MSNSNSTSINLRPCVKCGAIDRYKSGDCKPCASVMAAARYVADKDARLAYSAAYRTTNTKKINTAQVAYQKANPEKVKARNTAYRAAIDPVQAKAYQASYYLKNKDAITAFNAEYRLTNPLVAAAYREKNKAKLKASLSVWRLANTEKMAASAAAWAKANPGARRINQHNRRAKELLSGGVLSQGLAAKLFALQCGKCPCCKQALGSDYHLDHIAPLALGGSNTDENMQLLRARCNLQKHKKDPLAFMQARGFLL